MFLNPPAYELKLQQQRQLPPHYRRRLAPWLGVPKEKQAPEEELAHMEAIIQSLQGTEIKVESAEMKEENTTGSISTQADTSQGDHRPVSLPTL
jgi:predicted metalloenzyme YecM